GADGAAGPVAPGHRAAAAVPDVAGHDVVAVGQDDHPIPIIADLVGGVGADEAVGGGDDARDAARPVAPGHRAAVAVPDVAVHDVVAVGQGGHTEDADHLPARGADDAGGGGEAARGSARPGARGGLAAVGAP